MSATYENRIWNDILLAVEKRLNRQSFETWIRPIHFEGYDEAGHVLHLRAPNHVVKDWVSSNYSDVLEASLSELNLADYQVDWTVAEDSQSPNSVTRKEMDDLGTLDLQQPVANGSKNTSSSLFSLLEAAESDGLTPGATTFVDIEPLENSLNPKCAFGTFVVGSCNQFAHAAALAVAEAPGKTYNPLYI
jgi:chromosomal replication initiator protein